MTKRAWFRLLPAIIWAITLAILMLLPQDSFPESKLLSYDKIAHLGVFALLSILIMFGTSRVKAFNKTKRSSWLWPLIICILYSSSLELLQNFSPGRMIDLYDFIANVTGGIFGVIVFSIFIKNNLVISKLML